MSNAIRVGTFVVVFLALLMGAFVAVGRKPRGPKPLAYYAVFADVGSEAQIATEDSQTDSATPQLLPTQDKWLSGAAQPAR